MTFIDSYLVIKASVEHLCCAGYQSWVHGFKLVDPLSKLTVATLAICGLPWIAMEKKNKTKTTQVLYKEIHIPAALNNLNKLPT